METELDSWELRMASLIGESRDKRLASRGVKTSLKDEVLRVAGLIAFAKMFQIYFPINQDPDITKGLPDYIMFGSTIVVITTLDQDKPSVRPVSPPVDFFVFLTRRENTFTYMGFTTEKRMANTYRARDAIGYIYLPTYDELNPKRVDDAIMQALSHVSVEGGVLKIGMISE